MESNPGLRSSALEILLENSYCVISIHRFSICLWRCSAVPGRSYDHPCGITTPNRISDNMGYSHWYILILSDSKCQHLGKTQIGLCRCHQWLSCKCHWIPLSTGE